MRNAGNATGAGRRARTIPALLLVLALPLALRCGGTSEVTEVIAERPVFTSTSTAEAPDLVRLSGGEGLRSDQIQIEVSIGGPTTSSDIFAINFDIVFSDPTLVSTLSSAIGDVFTVSSDPLVPPPIAVVGAVIGDRVNVGVTKCIPDTGEGVDAAGATIVTIVFTTNHTGSTSLWLENGVALDSTGAAIGSIVFDDGEATITQP